jgi:polyisoprenoid-binding protein YceI
MKTTAREILQEARRIYAADGVVVPVHADVPAGCVCALTAVDRALTRMHPAASEWAGEADTAYRLVDECIGGGSAWGVMVAGADSRERVLAGYAEAIAAAARSSVAHMALTTGTHRFGPDNASLQVRTYREGMAAKAGHDLIIEVTRWDATVEATGEAGGWTVELSADPRSLEVREGVGGVKPLTDKDRVEIRKTIDAKVLGGRPIGFRAGDARLGDGGRLTVEGELSMAGTARPLSAQLTVEAGAVSGTIPLRQSDWGITPYRGLMGALKVRDEVDVVIEAKLPR